MISPQTAHVPRQTLYNIIMSTSPSGRGANNRIIIRVAIVLLLLCSAVFFVASRYKIVQFRDAKIDEILFYFKNGLAGGQSSSFTSAIWENIPYVIGLLIILLLPIILKLRWKKQPLRLRHQAYYAGGLFMISLALLVQSFSIPAYVIALAQSSKIYDQHYVDPRGVKLTFPSTKRNLIYIYVESLENTPAAKANGGMSDKSVIPELEKLALTNTSFSHRASGLGGALPAHGTTWTVAGMTAQSAGVPLKDGGVFGDRDRNGMGDFNKFLPGAYTLGQVLEKAGYNQSFLMGSNKAFGGRDKLLEQHGDYHIIDLTYAQKHGLVPQDYKVWWGYEDKKLFQFARDEATRLSKSDKPFNLQMLTVDTHFTDGWMDKDVCKEQFEAKYDNVHACASKQIASFVEWVKQQPFYTNTTIIISGDHLGMQTPYYEEKIAGAPYQRTIYNAFINPAVQPTRATNRQFAAFDMYPSTLAALGVTVDGDRMGLGTNLFSNRQTLVEEFGGIGQLNTELAKRSTYYERRILSSS